MAPTLDEYETLTNGRYPAMITGKPVGMEVRSAAEKRYGVVYVLKNLLREMNIDRTTPPACRLRKRRRIRRPHVYRTRRQDNRGILLESGGRQVIHLQKE